MTVPTEACDATLTWTGVETTYNLAFRAKAEADVYAKFIDADLIETPLVLDTDYSIALDPTTQVATLAPIVMPEAAGAIYVWRDTPATQTTDFEDLEDFPAETHTDLHDRAAMRDAEQKRRIARVENGISDTLADAVATAVAAATAIASAAASTATTAAGIATSAAGTATDKAGEAADSAEAAENALDGVLAGVIGAVGATVRVKVAATGQVNIANGLENGDTLDGIVLVTGDAVLLPWQTDPSQDGLYTVPASGAASRHAFFPSLASLSGCVVSVTHGTVNKDTLWQCTYDSGDTTTTTYAAAATPAVYTGNIGDMTGGGGLAAASDGTVATAAASCARTTGAALSGWVGKTTNAPRPVHSVVVYGSNNQGYDTNSNTTVTLSLYGKATSGVPSSATDGQLLGTLPFTDTTDESATPRTVTSNDTVTKFFHRWTVVSSGASEFKQIAEQIFYEPSASIPRRPFRKFSVKQPNAWSKTDLVNLNGDHAYNAERLTVATTGVTHAVHAAYYLSEFWTARTRGSQVTDGAIVEVFDLPGFTSAAKITVTTIDASPGTDKYLQFQHFVEGARNKRLMFGTSLASRWSLGFWVKSSVTGTYSVACLNNARTRSFVKSFSIPTANVWQWVALPGLPGDTAGAWESAVGTIGLRLQFSLMAGSGLATTEGVWTEGEFYTVSGQVNFAGTNGATFYITGAVLVPGVELPSAEEASICQLPFDENAQLCMRFYEKSYGYFSAVAAATATGAEQASGASGTQTVNVRFRVPKREDSGGVTAVGVTLYDLAGNPGKVTTSAGNNQSGHTVSAISGNGFTVTYPAVTSLAFHWTAASRL